jgi:hypothetical protein
MMRLDRRSFGSAAIPIMKTKAGDGKEIGNRGEFLNP